MKKLIIGLLVVVGIFGTIFVKERLEDEEIIQTKVAASETSSITQSSDSLKINTEKPTTTSEDLSWKYNTTESASFDIQFLNPSNDSKENWVFQLFINTHSVDLDQYDLKKMIEIRIDDKVISNVDVSKKGSGHHISYEISIPKTIQNADTIREDSKKITMIISDFENSDDLVFRWDLDGI